jgi:hypothetical protein
LLARIVVPERISQVLKTLPEFKIVALAHPLDAGGFTPHART